jgi:hypothetical protein
LKREIEPPKKCFKKSWQKWKRGKKTWFDKIGWRSEVGKDSQMEFCKFNRWSVKRIRKDQWNRFVR